MLKLRNIIWKIQVLVMSQLDPIRSSFDGICQKRHHENVAADLFHICQRRWYRTGTIEKPALQRYAGEMVLQSSGSYEYSWLGQKSMGETYGTHHRTSPSSWMLSRSSRRLRNCRTSKVLRCRWKWLGLTAWYHPGHQDFPRTIWGYLRYSALLNKYM